MTHVKRAERRVKILAAYEGGKSIAEIVSETGLSVQYVRRILGELLDAKPVKTLSVLKELFDNKRSLREIADDCGVTRQRVHQIYHDAIVAGIPGLPVR